MRKPIASIVLCTLASLASAAEFFVSPDGDDGNPGTKAQPFATLERARDAIRQAGLAGKEPCTVWLQG